MRTILKEPNLIVKNLHFGKEVVRTVSNRDSESLKAVGEFSGRTPVSHLPITVEQGGALIEVVVDQRVSFGHIEPRYLGVNVMKGVESFVVR